MGAERRNRKRGARRGVAAALALVGFGCGRARFDTEAPPRVELSRDVAARPRAGPPLDSVVRASGGAPPAAAPSGRATSTAASTRYVFRLDRALESLQARVCTSGYRASELEPPIPEARAYRSAESREADDCFRYSIDLKAAEKTWYGLASPRRLRNALVLSPDFWLWVPRGKPERGSVTARFELPPGFDAAVPWPFDADGVYRVPPSQFELTSQAAFGKLEKRRLRVGAAVIEVAALGGGWSDTESEVLAWLRRAAEAEARLLGVFPVERAFVLLVRDAKRKALFGYALRGGGPTVVLLMPDNPRPELLADDWVAVHELTHLAVPEMPREDAWLYEGIATYYTYVLRARAGLISEERAWANLFDGFARGEASETGATLELDSARMRRTHAYFRVYWAGAAFALAVDIELRKRGKSLDAALRELARVCDADTEYASQDLLTKLDAWIGEPVLVPLATEHLGRTGFADTERYARWLGVSPRSVDACQLDDSAKGAAVRRAISKGS